MSYAKSSTEVIAGHDEIARDVASLRLLGGDQAKAKYPQYLPIFPKNTYPAWQEISYVDAGTRGTKDKRHLLGAFGVRKEITPAIGEEIRGVQISQLTKKGLDDLALLAAERGLLIFRDQDFKDIGPQRQVDTVKHFGRLHLHPIMGHPEGFPEMHVVYRDPTDNTFGRWTRPDEIQRITSVMWHQDHTAELQPPGYTFFFALEAPASGGDTLFVSTAEAYDKLSDEFKKRLEGLYMVHDNSDMINHSKNLGGPARFEPRQDLHPLVRTHPATGRKYLFMSPYLGGHGIRIHGYKKEESDNLINFLSDVLLKNGDFQARAHYEPGTVIVWDNRQVCHSATIDFKGDERRHLIRIAAMSDVPKKSI